MSFIRSLSALLARSSKLLAGLVGYRGGTSATPMPPPAANGEDASALPRLSTRVAPPREARND